MQKIILTPVPVHLLSFLEFLIVIFLQLIILAMKDENYEWGSINERWKMIEIPEESKSYFI